MVGKNKDSFGKRCLKMVLKLVLLLVLLLIFSGSIYFVISLDNMFVSMFAAVVVLVGVIVFKLREKSKRRY